MKFHDRQSKFCDINELLPKTGHRGNSVQRNTGNWNDENILYLDYLDS